MLTKNSTLPLMNVFKLFTVVEITGSSSVYVVGTKHPTVKIYESLYNMLLYETKEQIAALLHTKESAITLEFTNVQVKIL